MSTKFLPPALTQDVEGTLKKNNSMPDVSQQTIPVRGRFPGDFVFLNLIPR